MFALNLKGAFFTAQACVPALKDSRGSIVNVASVAGIKGSGAGMLVYSTTKGAVVQMTRMMALALAPRRGAGEQSVPGWIDTPMIQHENELAGNNALYDFIDASVPLGRVGGSRNAPARSSISHRPAPATPRVPRW